MEPLERLLKLVALLLNAPRPLTFDEIRDEMGAYTQDDRDVAKRQFERDKDDLRRIGIPIETGGTDVYEVEVGYHIPKERYYLPEISFTPEEIAALFIAAHAPGPYEEAAQAFGKLARDADTAVISGLVDRRVPGLDDSSVNVMDAADAVARRRLVRFAYRPTGGEVSDREVDAWGLVCSRGAWYLVGRDRSAEDVRSFRLSRIVEGLEDAGDAEAPPERFDARDRLRSGPWGVGEPQTTATVAFSPKVAWWARDQAPGSTVVETRADGWTVLEVPASTDESFLGWVRAFGPDAELLAPEDLRRWLAGSLEEIRASL
ncbi:MAG TPA: WYL domain-containing protein [Actinomycetota bacterium]